MFRHSLLVLLLSLATTALAVPFSSRHALVVEEETGRVLLEKNAAVVVPIASLTKLMTAMVVLDAELDMDELIAIDESDVDTVKFSSSRVPVGASLSRRALLELSLMSSDNRAAAALARTYPGGHAGFRRAVRFKISVLEMRDSYIEEPTGLSANNRSTALDLVKMVTAAAEYPEISRMSTGIGELVDINGRLVEYRNTNRLVGRDGWDILISKTGFTREAGRCLVMRFQSEGRHLIVILLNASASTARMMDAENVQRYLNGQALISIQAKPKAAPKAKPKARSTRPTSKAAPVRKQRTT
jgi:serine-type D-Ala-D-Ala endopeptidase (penicillin-binding protein 7)